MFTVVSEDASQVVRRASYHLSEKDAGHSS